MEVFCSQSNPPTAGVFAAHLLNSQGFPVKVSWGNDNKIKMKNGKMSTFETQYDLLRILGSQKPGLYGGSAMDRITVEHWLSFSLTLNNDLENKLKYFNDALSQLTFLVGNELTIADLGVFSILNSSSGYANILKKIDLKNVERWMKLIKVQPCVVTGLQSMPDEAKANMATGKSGSSDRSNAQKKGEVDSTGRKEEGKFVDLPGAEMGKVIVRFPPEASGYLHIGHAKAALLNQYYQQAFQGKLIMRFDDTNPAKENVHFEQVILEDVAMLEIKPDRFTYTSDYFEMMLGMCERLLKEGKAYVDDTAPEQMKAEREQKVESANRSNSVDKNLQMWGEMLKGSEYGVKCCVRAKIDMQSPNGCMRDPTIYRCKPEVHPRTGTKYKVYPTYDFACPIVDAIEDVTHVLRTMEYHDRDPQFYWFIDALGLRKPHIWEYSRLSMTNTVLSKRKLTWFVEEGLVDGWDDPRFPTVRGVLRRGMTVEGLKQFIIAQGSSRSVVFMEWDKIWAFNKKVIDPIAPRFTALESSPKPVVVNVTDITSESSIRVAKHPKNADVGEKTVWISSRVLIDQSDAQTLKEGENATFINWGNIKIQKIHKSSDGTVTSVDAVTNLQDKDYKKTLKLTWLADAKGAKFTPTYCVFFDHIISKGVLAKDEDFKKYIGHNTRSEVEMLGDPELSQLKKGDIIQLQRRGFFKVDVAYQPPSALSGKETPCILFHIPDGHTKEQPTLQQTKQVATKSASPAKETKVIGSSSNNIDTVLHKIQQQGDRVRQLKEQKADKAQVTAEVQTLLALKSEYKKLSGVDWTPNAKPSGAATTAKPSATQVTSPAADGSDLLEKIANQGNTVRDLKTKKAAKGDIDAAVKVLLDLKADYKKQTGTDWNPNIKPSAKPEAKAATPPASNTGSSGADDVLEKITQQGNIVRDLKVKKAPKGDIDAAVKILLDLKADYKKQTGTDWNPNIKPSAKPTETAQQVKTETVSTSDPGCALLEKISHQGNAVRELKANKANKSDIDAAVKVLLESKGEYKKVTGVEWNPNIKPQKSKVQGNSNSSSNMDPAAAELTEKVNKQGNVVRDLKSNKASKDAIDAAVKTLLDLKAEYKKVTGTDFPVAGKPARAPAAKKENTPPAQQVKKEKQAPVKKEKQEDQSSGLKKQTRLGLEAKKETDLPDWYSQVITKGEMIEYYDVSGCYILRPWSYAIWDCIREYISKDIRKKGVKDCYFPIFVSKSALEREKTHIADFAPEVAWVTKSGESDLAEHIAIRPTSETVMYPAYAKWIQSHRDLPLRLNQWNNVVRWEFQHPQPFLRSREFLWQEGHTAFASKEEADAEVLEILDLYARVYTDLLAIPVVKGRKTEKEKFAGGDYTTTVEAFVSASGRGIQGATSHHLGQNFAKMFEIIYEDPDTHEKKYVYQNSWGLTTRTIGVMVMVHADNQGLVLPPRVAALQVVIVPCGITASTSQEDRAKLIESCRALEEALGHTDIRVQGDFRDNYSPGWKFNHWELKGVPIRIELGPKDMAASQLVAVRRDTGEKLTIKRDTAVADITKLLETIHNDMLKRATEERDSHMIQVSSWEEFNTVLDGKNIILAPFCGRMPCEDNIKKESARTDAEVDSEGMKLPAMGAKALCIPFQQPRALMMQDKCVHPACTDKPRFFTLFGRSY